MKNVTGIVVAVVSLIAMPGWADQPRTDPQAVVTEKPDPTLTPRDMNEKEQDYLAALKKCEPLAEGERRKCAAAAKSKYGVM